jgi:hypothetical protein
MLCVKIGRRKWEKKKRGGCCVETDSCEKKKKVRKRNDNFYNFFNDLISEQYSPKYKKY